MTNPSNRIEEQVPLHYREYAQLFIVFMKRYYEWLYRESGLSEKEIEELKSDTTWVDEGYRSLYEKISALSNTPNPGAISKNFIDNVFLEERDFSFITADDQYLTDSNEELITTPLIDENYLNDWFSSMAMTRVTSDKSSGDIIDEVLMISLMKHIYGIKGTEKSIKLFFNIYFNEDVTIYHPKFDIAVIDDNWILDTTGVIRDDYYYNEYSYVIRVTDDVEKYQEIFDKVYLKNIHPAGFKVFLEKSS